MSSSYNFSNRDSGAIGHLLRIQTVRYATFSAKFPKKKKKKKYKKNYSYVPKSKANQYLFPAEKKIKKKIKCIAK